MNSVKVVGESVLTFEELATIFCRVEGILNSRPLSSLGTDPAAVECLTPGHFLIGKPITAPPEERIQETKNLHQRWKLVSQKAQHFWNRWRTEYIHQLQQRKKWTKDTANLKADDLVIVEEPNVPQRTWPLARVVETHPGKDGVVRVATIKTGSGIYKRPVAKLVPLTPLNG
ncbi:uncharacterized protein [Rhodnius prolixus]|uniref:uncharacterized protein n=1 Tax=Rhodnius prolixus TaxID=13249 RepID=UPI003D18F5BC